MYRLLLFLFVIVQLLPAQTSPRLFQMSPAEVDSILTEQSRINTTITERMAFYSELFLETNYSWTCTGDGLNALYEPYPLVNFQETNCMAYCEHVLALAVSDSWDNFFNNLQQIRYRNGMIGMRSRNHYTMGDWLPENDWLLRSVTAEVAGNANKQVTRTISHEKFFAGKGITDLRHVLADREITIDYLSKKSLDILPNGLRSGDIGALIFAKKTDIFSAHMFMFYLIGDQWIVRESSNSKMSTFDTPLSDWIEKIQNSERYIGISLMRVREDLDSPGKIILPDEIAGLKTKYRATNP
jgi:hypothetical protein